MRGGLVGGGRLNVNLLMSKPVSKPGSFGKGKGVGTTYEMIDPAGRRAGHDGGRGKAKAKFQAPTLSSSSSSSSLSTRSTTGQLLVVVCVCVFFLEGGEYPFIKIDLHSGGAPLQMLGAFVPAAP